VLRNPSADDLRRLTEEQPTSHLTSFGNLDVITKVTARSKQSTFIVTDDPSTHTDATITRAEYEALAAMQDEHLRGKDVIVLDGYIGDHPDARVRTRLVVDKEYPNWRPSSASCTSRPRTTPTPNDRDLHAVAAPPRATPTIG
jgi:phosphoenolpyruvate carboxykinase (ATP)